jgi:K+-transporting ATPase ATPase C chain
MLQELRPAFVMMVLMTVLTGVAYPLAITGVAQAVFPRQANGSLITYDGEITGSSLIGQSFARPEYF